MPKTLPNNKTPHSQYKIYSKQTKTTNTAKDSRDVWQDKDAPSRVREASFQPVMVGNTPRTSLTNTKSQRVQNHHNRHRLVQVAAWVDKPIREQILHIAQQEGLSVSATIAALLEEILRQRFHIQQAATLETVLEKIIARSQRSLATRLVALLVRIAFDSGQTRVLSTNILGMQEGMTQENLKEIASSAEFVGIDLKRIYAS